ncbi:MAG: hypothetical protein D6766_11885 [Verrucomicrobia bacterium]|nr:MAG: hypothetical protein D6766_11885 [Verrucomicrobiota bacterium]
MSQREAWLAAAFLELLVAWLVARAACLRVAGLWLVWFAGCVTLYRVGLWSSGIKTCGCLGALKALMSQTVVGWLAWTLLGLIWAIGLLLLRSRRDQREVF